MVSLHGDYFVPLPFSVWNSWSTGAIEHLMIISSSFGWVFLVVRTRGKQFCGWDYLVLMISFSVHRGHWWQNFTFLTKLWAVVNMRYFLNYVILELWTTCSAWSPNSQFFIYSLIIGLASLLLLFNTLLFYLCFFDFAERERQIGPSCSISWSISLWGYMPKDLLV